MKKTISFCMLVFALSLCFTSCQDPTEEYIDTTNTEQLNALDDQDNLIASPPPDDEESDIDFGDTP